MFTDVILFITGFILLIKGADILVEGASSIAKKYGVSSFVVGLTIVAFGTSAPELFISVLASAKGSTGIALGNIIGANITNTLLILGVCALITPLMVKNSTVNKEIPFSLLAILAVGILVNDFLIDGASSNGLSRIDGLILILFFSIFIYYTFGITKSKENIFKKTIGEINEEKLVEHGFLYSSIMVIGGLIGLALGGYWIINSAMNFAALANVTETFIGLTIVAIGTTLPEFAASGMAAYKGKADIAVGNIIGSNIFNFLWVLGLSSVISTIGFNSILNIDIMILFGVTVSLFLLIYIGRRNVIDRWEGGLLVGLYILYLIYVFIRG